MLPITIYIDLANRPISIAVAVYIATQLLPIASSLCGGLFSLMLVLACRPIEV